MWPPSTSVIRTYPHFTLPRKPPILLYSILSFLETATNYCHLTTTNKTKKLKKYVHNYYKLREINTYLPQSILFIDCLERKKRIKKN